jgi:hypothetical protein
MRFTIGSSTAASRLATACASSSKKCTRSTKKLSPSEPEDDEAAMAPGAGPAPRLVE